MQDRFGVKARLAGLFLSLAFHGCALAGTIDCDHATSPGEKFICGNPYLSRRDEQLATVYEERSALLSARGAELLRRSERSWLRYATTVCPLVVPADADIHRKPGLCLARQYDDRELDLFMQVGQKLGPFVFSRIDVYDAEPASDQTGTMVGFYVHHVAYPQIDSPSSPEAAAWNKRMVRELPGPPLNKWHVRERYNRDGCDHDTSYQIGYATRRMISVQWFDEGYCHGAAHGLDTVNAENFLLQPTFRAVTAKDVFGPTDHWAEGLQDLFWDALGYNGANVDEDRVEGAKSDLKDYLIQPGAWLFTADGLKVSFSDYATGDYADTPRPVTVPWAKLKPLLSPSAVVP